MRIYDQNIFYLKKWSPNKVNKAKWILYRRDIYILFGKAKYIGNQEERI